MTNIALIFPGQGAQKVGMGKEFYDTSPKAKEIFDCADSIIGNGLKEVIFNGPQEKLTETSYCQPAILTFSIAALEVLKGHPKFADCSVKFTAGLSLGEYSALVACGAVSLDEGLKLVKIRGSFMEEATKLAKGTMAAVIGFDKEKLKEICAQTGAQIANFNSNEQIVITGYVDKVQKACEIIQQEGAKSVIPLTVSGAFHSSLMQPAADKFKEELNNFSINPPVIPIISNVNAHPSSDPSQIQANLASQITSSVQWVATIEYMAGQGITDFLEIGPGRVLKGLIRKINPELKVHNIQTPADIEKLPF